MAGQSVQPYAGKTPSAVPCRVSESVRCTRPRQWRVIRALVRRVESLQRLLNRVVASAGSRSRAIAALYYAVASTAFRREQHAFLAGRNRFLADAQNPQNTSALLRRSVHRLEKGLLMRPRREVFALDYIEDVTKCYERIITSPNACQSFTSAELRWAGDVLAEFFAVAGSHPKIDRCRARFQRLPIPELSDATKSIPYQRDLTGPAPIRYDDLLALSLRRRSVRWFQQKPVPRAELNKALAVATQSPSACNRQPFVFRIFDEPELTRQVAAIPAGTSGFSHNFPVVVVIVGQQRNYVEERDRHVIYIDGSLAAMSFIYALETLGLSSCCINWPDIEEREREMARVLKLDPDERPIMLIAVGYPDPEGLVAFSQKKPPEQISRFNFE